MEAPQVPCSHLDLIQDVEPSADGCEDCLRIGGWWVHLRLCLSCGHVGCCDNSPNRHATAHVGTSGHPIVRSFEPGEDWTGATSTRSTSSLTDRVLHATRSALAVASGAWPGRAFMLPTDRGGTPHEHRVQQPAHPRILGRRNRPSSCLPAVGSLRGRKQLTRPARHSAPCHPDSLRGRNIVGAAGSPPDRRLGRRQKPEPRDGLPLSGTVPRHASGCWWLGPTTEIAPCARRPDAGRHRPPAAPGRGSRTRPPSRMSCGPPRPRGRDFSSNFRRVASTDPRLPLTSTTSKELVLAMPREQVESSRARPTPSTRPLTGAPSPMRSAARRCAPRWPRAVRPAAGRRPRPACRHGWRPRRPKRRPPGGRCGSKWTPDAPGSRSRARDRLTLADAARSRLAETRSFPSARMIWPLRHRSIGTVWPGAHCCGLSVPCGYRDVTTARPEFLLLSDRGGAVQELSVANGDVPVGQRSGCSAAGSRVDALRGRAPGDGFSPES